MELLDRCSNDHQMALQSKIYTDSYDKVTGMLNLFVLMYADDSVIMAENEHDMQRNLNLLNDYCNCNKQKVNISKTKIMVFARSKTRLNNIGPTHIQIWKH